MNFGLEMIGDNVVRSDSLIIGGHVYSAKSMSSSPPQVTVEIKESDKQVVKWMICKNLQISSLMWTILCCIFSPVILVGSVCMISFGTVCIEQEKYDLCSSSTVGGPIALIVVGCIVLVTFITCLCIGICVWRKSSSYSIS